ncbi:unnamed protein product [Rotaria magnacalcarata]|uniref:DDE-1 domain-containing protein n=1 Tax=Rotaria magnacalcarata TaxID=392030 RepID=A0A8S3ILE8_9BILA|nr:unnamed protein product [Rotaria magnacalcarata]
MDQGVIRAFKVYYRCHLVKHIIISAGVAVTTDDINITALDVVYWIQGACEAVSETTIRNTFKSAGIEKLSVIDGIDAVQQISITDEIISAEDKSIEELDRVLRHLTIGGKPMSGYDIICVINGIINDDGDSNEDKLNDDVPSEDPPSLSEFIDLISRLCFFSTMQQPELHSFIIEL